MLQVERRAEVPSAWEDLVAQAPRTTLFLRPRWMKALLHAYPHYRPLVLVARDGDRVAGILPAVTLRRYGFRQILSLPFGTHGGPVVPRGGEGEVEAALARAFREEGGGLDVMRFEMTVYDPSPETTAALDSWLGETGEGVRTHEIALVPGNDAFRRSTYPRGTRRSLDGAERAGVTVTWGTGEERIVLLAKLHARQSRDWVGIPPHPEGAIRAMAAGFGDDARIYTAEREGTPLAACLVLRDGDEAVPWVSGALPEARERHAFHLLIHAALGDAAARGCRRWHFGGSGGNPRIEYFKESFGARPVPMVRYHRLAGWARKLRRRPAWDA